jgi:hypothetical protein
VFRDRAPARLRPRAGRCSTVTERIDPIEAFYLPSYAPELNPEHADMKHAIGTKVPVRTKAKLETAAEDHMTMIGTSPERVSAYFQDPRGKYAV